MISKLHGVAPATHNPRVHRAPRREAPPLDQVRLSGGPVSLPAGRLAAQSASAGAVGPVIARELEELGVSFLRTKHFRLPFTAEKKTIDAGEAAKILNSGDASGLSVDRGRGAQPLTSLEHLAVLEQVQRHSTQRPLDQMGKVVTSFTQFSDAKGARMDAYTAYLELREARPVVALETGIPVGTLDPEALGVPSLASAQALAEKLASDQPVTGLRQLVGHLRTFRQDDADAVRADLAAFPAQGVHESGRALLAQVQKSYLPLDELEAVLGRLETLPLSAGEAAETLEAWNFSGSRSADVVLAALDVVEARPEAREQLNRLGGRWRSNYYTSETVAALGAMAAGAKGLPHDAEAVKTMVARTSSYGGENATAAYQTAVTGGRPPLEAMAQLERIEQLAESSGLGRYALGTLFGSYAEHPDAYPLLEQLAPMKINDLRPIVALLKPLPQEQAVEATRRLVAEGPECLRREGIALSTMEGLVAELAAKTPFEEAVARLEGFGQALESGSARYDYHAPLVEAYGRLVAGRDDDDPVRQLASELAAQGRHGQSETGMLEAVAGSKDPSQSAELVRSVVLSGPFPGGNAGLALAQAALADLDAGTPVETVRERLSPLVESLKGSYETYVVPLFEAYREGLAGGPELDPGRELLAFLVERKQLGETGASALKAALAPAGATALALRVETLKALTLDGPAAFRGQGSRQSAMAAWRAEIAAGATPETARERVLALGQAIDARGQNYEGYVTSFLDGYAETVAGEDGHAFALDLVGRGLVGDSGAAALRAALAPAGDLDVKARTEAFRRLCLEGPSCFNMDKVRTATWQAFCSELAAGTTPEEAHARLEQLGQALAARNYHYADYLTPVVESYGRNLAGGAELEPGREFLKQILAGLSSQEAAACVDAVVPAAGSTSLAERIETFTALCQEGPAVFNNNNIRQDVMEAFRAELSAGTSPDEARRRLLELGTAMAGISYTQYARPLVQLYRDKLAGDESLAPGRQLLLDVAAAGIHSEEAAKVVTLALEPWDDLPLKDRVRLVKELTVTGPAPLRGVRQEVVDAVRAELAAGTTQADAVSRLTRLGQSLQERSVTWPDYVAPVVNGYAQHLAGPEALEPLRVLLDDMVKAGHNGDYARTLLAAAVSLGEVLPAEEAAQACRDLVLTQKAPTAVLSVLRAELEAGADRQGAQVRMGLLLEAMERTGFRYNQEALLDLYAKQVAGAPDGAVRVLAELVDRGAGIEELQKKVPDLMVLLKRLTRSGMTALEFERLVDAALAEIPEEQRWGAVHDRVKTAAELKLASLAPEPGGIEYAEDEVWVGDFNLPTQG